MYGKNFYSSCSNKEKRVIFSAQRCTFFLLIAAGFLIFIVYISTPHRIWMAVYIVIRSSRLAVHIERLNALFRDGSEMRCKLNVFLYCHFHWMSCRTDRIIHLPSSFLSFHLHPSNLHISVKCEMI